MINSVYPHLRSHQRPQFPIPNPRISAVRIDFAAGGNNPSHVHPTVTEILYVLQGSLYVGWRLNVGIGNAAAFAAQSSQNPGMQQIAPALFGTDIHDRVLQKGFKINARTVNAIEALFAP
uniref:Cupin type-1 domain-containing protein n=1 Tax=Physcomitrium patens TaxID=3218 RepID=A0A2K1JCT7_PHYPA|nr:hypothetical protein PHYPA_019624 [Physcomitrium patens]